MSTPRPPGPIVYTAEQIAERVASLAGEISRDYQGRPLHLITVLRGGLLFMTDLARHLEGPITMDFVAVARQADESPQLLKDLDSSVEGRDLLVVEDVVNEGRTLHYVLDLLKVRGPASLKVCAMFYRPGRPAANDLIHYRGLPLPDEFVVGYGLDYRQLYRHLPCVARLEIA